MSSKHLVLSINDGLYAIAVSFVHKIAALPRITRLPHTPPYILGVANIDGNIYTIIDLRVKFGAPAGLSEPETGILPSQEENRICMIGDQIFSLIDICPEDILIPPQDDSYISGVIQTDASYIGILSVPNLLHTETDI